mmetsp:Transcript_31011/g.70602  ORF Transcript_31011/g.70602 Transcript_31011/m.70602 type:complete len:91 (+) Transcript_31011:319-591(+)
MESGRFDELEVMKSIDVACCRCPRSPSGLEVLQAGAHSVVQRCKCINTGNFMCGLNTLNAFFSKKATAARVKAFCAVARRGLRGLQVQRP